MLQYQDKNKVLFSIFPLCLSIGTYLTNSVVLDYKRNGVLVE